MVAEAKTFGEQAEIVLGSVASSAAANTTCSGAWCAYAGVFDLEYNNGYTNQFTITGAGHVTSSKQQTSGDLVASNDSNCPDGHSCARLDGIYAGVYELLAVTPSGNLAVNHMQSATNVKAHWTIRAGLEGRCSLADEQLSRQAVMAA